MIQKNLATLVVVAFGISMGSSASADHASKLVTQSELLTYQTKDLKNLIRDDYRRSRLFGRLMSVSSRMKGTSYAIRNKARSYSATCGIGKDIARMDELIYELDSLLDDAQRRAAIGLDQPICNDTYAVAEQVGQIKRSMRIITRRVARNIGPPVQILPVVPAEFPPSYDLEIGPGELAPPSIVPQTIVPPSFDSQRAGTQNRTRSRTVDYGQSAIAPPLYSSRDLDYRSRATGPGYGSVCSDRDIFDEACSIGRFRYGYNNR